MGFWVVMNRYEILNSVSVFSGRNTEVSVSVSVLKSVWNRYEFGMKSLSESVLNWRWYEILCNLLPAAVSITLQSNPKSIGSRYLTIRADTEDEIGIISKKKKKFFFQNTEFRFGIGSKSVRYRYTEPINRYTESQYIVSSLIFIFTNFWEISRFKFYVVF